MNPTFVNVANVNAFAENDRKVVYFKGREVAIFKVEDAFYAVDNLCPHRGAPLCTGEVTGNVVVCPWHEARFALSTGEGLPGAHQANIASYNTRICGDFVQLLHDGGSGAE